MTGRPGECVVPASRVLLPARPGPRPATTGREIPHDQLDQHSPPGMVAAVVEAAAALPGVVVGRSLVSEPASVGFRCPGGQAEYDAYLWADEFAHVHASGFLHIAAPPELVDALVAAGWAERHPITRRPGFPATIVMLYAPRDGAELELACDVLRRSYARARGG